MKNKSLRWIVKSKKEIRWLQGVQYWIAVVSYLVIFSLSILCLVSYLPNLSGTDVLDSGTLNLLKALFIIMLVSATAFLGWEMLQWRKGRKKKNQQSSLEDIVKNVKGDSDNSK